MFIAFLNLAMRRRNNIGIRNKNDVSNLRVEINNNNNHANKLKEIYLFRNSWGWGSFDNNKKDKDRFLWFNDLKNQNKSSELNNMYI